jgi:hypothetical protein
MISQVELDNVIKEMNVTRKATVAEFLFKLFKGKFIEVYIGDIYEQVSTEQVSSTFAAVFSGRVIAAYRECLILEGSYIDRATNKWKVGKQIFISERAIKGFCEIDGNGILEDIFLRSREATEVKDLYLNGE